MSGIRVLVVDDSAAVRRLIRMVLDEEPAIGEVVAEPGGRNALARLARERMDLVVLDLEMPDMSGLDVLRALRQQHLDVPVIVFSAAGGRGDRATVEALALGAVDFVTKPVDTGSVEDALEYMRTALLERIRSVFRTQPSVPREIPRAPARLAPGHPVSAVLIAASMGGPHALTELLASLPRSPGVPFFVVQHMPAAFISIFTKRLAASALLSVRECVSEETVAPDTLWFATGGRHMEVARRGKRVVVRPREGEPVNFCRPAADVLFASAARTWGAGVLAVVMTGMGQDGLEGAGAVREQGGRVLVQDRESSVVWGMAGAVARHDLADAVVPLHDLGAEIMCSIGASRRS